MILPRRGITLWSGLITERCQGSGRAQHHRTLPDIAVHQGRGEFLTGDGIRGEYRREPLPRPSPYRSASDCGPRAAASNTPLPVRARIADTVSSMTPAVVRLGRIPANSCRNQRNTFWPCGERTTSG